MAEIVDGFPGPRGWQISYPWDQWTDGKIRKLTRGVDFFIDVRPFQNVVNQWAARHGKTIMTRSAGNDVYLQCTGSRQY